ncbi:site-specific integrase [Flavobacterium sp. ANB]|uniref:site-specific integrase n=1 Tax=unclassified Flavobacterium TaxID=196869 RepID=UPI0012B9069A|nr:MULTISPECIES: site-specific integrase [unclassified Flavobacterium]MBF4519283.1 site-specific integrase [Flavobacterium sp. ANB]MTD72226.1 tyrosine-type recombinase/integrase [Flavobacterium sp. LC2016-13]
MLESSFGLIFFLKIPRDESKIRNVYLRIIIDGIRTETSTKRKWDINRWDPKAERAIGNKEDARSLNFFLDSLILKVNEYKTEIMYSGKPVTSKKVMEYVLGKNTSKVKVLEEFQKHNDEMTALLGKGYAKGTLDRFTITKNHLTAFIKFKFKTTDLEFTDLNLEFIKDFEFYLRTVRDCSNNTTLKYIANFKKIVIRAIDKEVILKDPFKNFKGRKTKLVKKPLTSQELYELERHYFTTDRLNVVRDVFVFQCYTGMAYIDAYQLKKTDIKDGIDGNLWIMSERQKTNSTTNVPLLPPALKIIEKYKDHPLCLQRGTVLPVSSNQKMNEYLKEIAILCGFPFTLNTHMARRTFGSTVTLNNNVPINVVKELLGHASVKQTEAYAITEQKTIGREMSLLNKRLNKTSVKMSQADLAVLNRLEKEIQAIKKKYNISS